MNTNIENYIRYTYPSRDIKEGLALYNRGHVSGPDMLSDDVYIYHVHETTCHARVLIWEGKYSAPISVTCSNNLARNRYCVACLNAHSKFRSSGDMSYNPALQAKGLPESIANHPLFDIRYELEGWHEESNSEVFEEVAGEFVGRLLRSNRHPREIVDALDLAVNECNRYDRFDASYAATIIADSRDDVSSLLSTMDDMDLVRILSNTDRQYSRKWILGSRDGPLCHRALPDTWNPTAPGEMI